MAIRWGILAVIYLVAVLLYDVVYVRVSHRVLRCPSTAQIRPRTISEDSLALARQISDSLSESTLKKTFTGWVPSLHSGTETIKRGELWPDAYVTIATPWRLDNGELNRSGLTAMALLEREVATSRTLRSLRLALYDRNIKSGLTSKLFPASGVLIHMETVGSFSESPNSQEYKFPLNWLYPATGNFAFIQSHYNSRGLVNVFAGHFQKFSDLPLECLKTTTLGTVTQSPFLSLPYPTLDISDTGNLRLAGSGPINYEGLIRLVYGIKEAAVRIANDRHGTDAQT